MKAFITSLLVAALFICGIITGMIIQTNVNKSVQVVGVTLLENSTRTYVNIPYQMKGIYKKEDTIWVDLSTHTINDTSNFTMKAVIK